MNKEIELIKEKIDIVDFISQYIKLEPAGKNFKALCPFHSEKTPSFIVSPEKQIWHCFGACQEGGDVLKFLMKYENLDFYEALQFLAQKVGIELKKVNPQHQREIGIIFELNERANLFFQKNLKENQEVLDYLIKKRGLSEKTIRDFSLGYAPGGESLTLYLLNLGYDIKDILKAGLSFKNLKGLYVDRFEKRIIFPYFNSHGKVVGFNGRILPDFEKENVAKYLNSPETIIFNKSKLFFGFYQNKSEIIKEKSVCLVEGPFDLLSFYEVGIKNVLALSGGNLTKEHLQILKRLVDLIYLTFDKDEAGLKYLENAFILISQFDFEVKVINLKEFKDPGEVLLKDKEFLKEAYLKAEYFFDYLFNFYLSENLNLSEKKRILRRLLFLLKFLKSAIERENWLKKLALKSGVSETSLIEEMNLLKEKNVKNFSNFDINFKNFNEKNRYDLILEKILLFFVYNEEFLKRLDEIKPYLFNEIDFEGDYFNFLKLKATYELEGKDLNILKEEFEILINSLKLEFLKIKREEIRKQIKQAELKKDEVALDNLAKIFHDITIEINKFSGK